MPLTPQQLELATGILTLARPGANPLPEMRRQLQGLAVTRCDAEDMNGEKPFRRLPDYDLFLIDSANHCVRLVDEPGDASGFIVAARRGTKIS